MNTKIVVLCTLILAACGTSVREATRSTSTTSTGTGGTTASTNTGTGSTGAGGTTASMGSPSTGTGGMWCASGGAGGGWGGGTSDEICLVGPNPCGNVTCGIGLMTGSEPCPVGSNQHSEGLWGSLEECVCRCSLPGSVICDGLCGGSGLGPSASCMTYMQAHCASQLAGCEEDDGGAP